MLLAAGSVAVGLAGLVRLLPTPDPRAGATGTPAVRSDAAAELLDLPAGSFLVRNVRLFDGERMLERASVSVVDGRISAVDPAAGEPWHTDAATGGFAALPVVDGRGRTLLPGLIDAHTHSWGDALERALRFGVTTQLDQFGDAGTSARLAAEQRDGGAAGRADLLSAGTLVTRAGGHGTQFGIAIPTLEPGADADAFVAARLAEGSAWIKIVIEDGHELGLEPQLPTLDAAQIAAVVAAAHRRGVLAVAHVHALDAARMAVAAGVDGLVHTVVDELPGEALVAEMAARGVFVVPTLSVLGSPAANGEPAPGSGVTLASDPRLLPYLRSGEVTQLGRAGIVRTAASGTPKVVSRARASVARLRAAGVPILAGTDAANPGTTWGASLHGELELLVDAGLSPVEALAAATGRVATAYGLGDRGRIEPGRRADLVLIEGDPTADIRATRAIIGVWKGGQPLARRPAAAPRLPRLEATASLLADFDSEPDGATPVGWATTTDAVMGGESTVELGVRPAAASSGQVLAVRGQIRPGFPFPWAGATLWLGTQPMAPIDLAGRTVLRFRARGDALRVMVLADGLSQPIATELPGSPAWSERRVDLTTIGVPERGVTALLFCGGPSPGSFAFELDDVHLEAPAAVGAAESE
ncbi:MAG: amidohydrolase family protein [Thermoanaerobaculia bacterium]|nr:MAG: amidohydrolase family protein [Thermoanaerobaculia bacterium]MBZ0100831.1 amidohydrolase family protein [Thermoanaerobaculia bacterium]